MIIEKGVNGEGEEGHWKYYYNDGKLRMEGDYLKGEKNGIWTIYYPNGKTKATGAYSKDKKKGPWKYYNSKGTPIPPNPALIEKDKDWFTYSGIKD